MISYSLSKNLSGEKILKDIQKLVNKYQGSKDNMILTIRVTSITNDDSSLIPKLEYHGDADCIT